MKPKMIGAHITPKTRASGLVPKRPKRIDGGIHTIDFIRSVYRAADLILNRPKRPRP